MIKKIKELFFSKKEKKLSRKVSAPSQPAKKTYNSKKNNEHNNNDYKNKRQSHQHKPHYSKNKSGQQKNKEFSNREEIKIDFIDTLVAQPKDDWQLSEELEKEEGKKQFFDFDLPNAIFRSLYENKFFYCTPIQEETFQHSLAGLDVAGKAQTGTGKTVAFLVAVYNHLLRHPLATQKTGTPRCVIIAPTRELAIQISDEAKLLGKYCDTNVATLYGGVKYEAQIEQLKGRVDILVGTPGRLTDCWRKEWVDLKKVEVVVLDEADRMLDMGFIRDIQRLLVNMPLKKHRLTLLFSATYDESIKRLLNNFLRENYQYIDIKTEEAITNKIDQIIYTVQKKDKVAIILWYLRNEPVERMIIFVNRRDEAFELSQQLLKYNLKIATLSSDVKQHKRQRTLQDFEAGKLQIIVATDVMGRGIHIDNVSHVINYELPYEAEDYVHRIGRTGRAGKVGKAISFACEGSGFELPAIEEYIGAKLDCQQPKEEMLVI